MARGSRHWLYEEDRRQRRESSGNRLRTGLTVTAFTHHRVRRVLPISGEVLVA
jgi:hypothetical protein